MPQVLQVTLISPLLCQHHAEHRCHNCLGALLSLQALSANIGKVPPAYERMAGLVDTHISVLAVASGSNMQAAERAGSGVSASPWEQEAATLGSQASPEASSGLPASTVSR